MSHARLMALPFQIFFQDQNPMKRIDAVKPQMIFSNVTIRTFNLRPDIPTTSEAAPANEKIRKRLDFFPFSSFLKKNFHSFSIFRRWRIRETKEGDR